MKTTDLTLGERYLIDRRRRNESQREAAGRLEFSLYGYRQIELDVEDAYGRPERIPLGVLKPNEGCYLRRRRAGITVEALAKTLDVSRWWLIQMEKGEQPFDVLLDHWAA